MGEIRSLTRLRHIRRRRRVLQAAFDLGRLSGQLAESCIPSYCHANLAAALVAWWRLFKAVELAGAHVESGPVLDFGASAGELGHLLPGSWEYHFVERDEKLAEVLLAGLPGAVAQRIEALPSACYQAVFALDSLEHNDDPGRLLELLGRSLREDGRLVLSGPSENWMYRLGRWLAGFRGGYHQVTVYDLHREAFNRFRLLEKVSGPWWSRLFVISVWARI